MEASRRIVRRVRYAIRILDDFSGEEVKDGIRFSIDGQLEAPMKKPGGLHIFMERERSSGPLLIQSAHYFDAVVEPKPDDRPIDEIITVRMIPRPSYPFGDRATLLRFRVDPAPNPESPYQVHACFSDPDYYHCRLTENLSEREVKLLPVYEPLQSGEVFFIQEEDHSEFVAVQKVLDNDLVMLCEPMHYTYQQGQKLYKSFVTRTDSDGYCVIYLSGLHRSPVQLRVTIAGDSETKEVEVSLSEGETSNIGLLKTGRRE